MEPDSFLKDFKTKLSETVSHFAAEIKSFQTGRAHPSLLDGVAVEAYGTKMPLSQLASVLTGEAAVLHVTPFDADNVPAVRNAISADDKLNLNPTDDGRVVYVNVPPLTTERRRQIAKNLAALKEGCLVKQRQLRHQALKRLRDDSPSEEEAKALEKDVEKLMASAKEEVDGAARDKTNEILEI